MTLIDSTREALTRQMGPLPLFGWVALGGVGFALYRAIKAHGATTQSGGAAASSGDSTSAGSGDGGASGGASYSPYGPLTLSPGSSVYDPSTGNTSTAPGITPKDLLGGSAADFAKSLGPNYNSFSFGEGSTSLAVSNSAQNIVDAANYQAGLNAQVAQHNADLAAQAHWLDTWTNYILQLRQLQGPNAAKAA